MQESSFARWQGIFRLSRRQLQQRWLESLFILLGLAMGVGVFTGMESYLRSMQAMSNQFMRTSADFHAIRIASRRLDYSSFSESGSTVPAIRVSEESMAPVQLELSDLLALREAVPSVGSTLLSQDRRRVNIVAIDGQSVGAQEASPDGTDSRGDGTEASSGGGGVILNGVGTRRIVGDRAEDRWRIEIQMCSPDEFAFTERQFLAGAPFSWDDFIAGDRRIVLEEEAAGVLFPDLSMQEVLGHQFSTGGGAQGDLWQVVGVVAKSDSPLDERVLDSESVRLVGYAPPPRGRYPVSRFYVVPQDPAHMEQLAREVQAYLDQLHGPGRVEARMPMEGLDQSGTIRAMLILAGLALLIAAVNILNLFTARVLRRQRYTGMSLALGATRAMLFWQTTGEALLLGLCGSLLGLPCAAGVIWLLKSLLRAQAGEGSVYDPFANLGLTPIDALIGLFLGTVISLIFGLYPAWLAARQEPAEALRTE